MECSFKPYEGDEPYIFVSYSHNDTQNIFPIMEELNKAGFRIWYDKGIEWGSIWTIDLVDHINKCNVVMAFISRNSICSPHCQNEILYAASISKHFFPIYLEELILPPHLHAIKDLYDTQEKYFQNLSFKSIIMEPQASYPKDKPKCDVKFSMTMEEFEKQISKKGIDLK